MFKMNRCALFGFQTTAVAIKNGNAKIMLWAEEKVSQDETRNINRRDGTCNN
jgi:hypothetical protein